MIATACTGLLASAMAFTMATAASAQTYNPYLGSMDPQAAPRMPVEASTSNTVSVGKQIKGIAEVIGPAMISVQGYDLRLHGIIVPLERAAQTKASADLIRLTKGNPVDCVTVGMDSDGITLAACGTDLYPNLALALLDAGRALVDRQQVAGTPVADLYLDAERQARRADLGLWGNETGPIPTHTAGIDRQITAAPTALAPPAPKPLAMNTGSSGSSRPAVSGGPIIRFDDGSSVDLSMLGAVPMSAAPEPVGSTFVPPDLAAQQGIGQSAFDAVSFNTLGLRALPDDHQTGILSAQPQVASLDGSVELPATLPGFEDKSAQQSHNSMLLGLIGHLDDIIQRHRVAKERGEMYLPTPPGEEPRTVPMETETVTPQDSGSGYALLWGSLLALLIAGLGTMAAQAYRWHQGIWPWERRSVNNSLGVAWADRQRRAQSLAQTLNQEALNLSFALSERADIARLASTTRSGQTASDLRALRINPPGFIGDNWHDIGRFSRSIGLQARMLHTQIAEFDRRVADQAALATEGRLHTSSDKVFAALAKRLEELSQAAKQLHVSVKSRSQSPNLKRQTKRVARPVQKAVRTSVSSPQDAGWAAAARA